MKGKAQAVRSSDVIFLKVRSEPVWVNGENVAGKTVVVEARIPEKLAPWVDAEPGAAFSDVIEQIVRLYITPWVDFKVVVDVNEERDIERFREYVLNIARDAASVTKYEVLLSQVEKAKKLAARIRENICRKVVTSGQIARVAGMVYEVFKFMVEELVEDYMDVPDEVYKATAGLARAAAQLGDAFIADCELVEAIYNVVEKRLETVIKWIEENKNLIAERIREQQAIVDRFMSNLEIKVKA